MAERREPNERERELALEALGLLGIEIAVGHRTLGVGDLKDTIARALAAYGDERERGGRNAAAEKLADNFARVMHIEYERGFEAGRKAHPAQDLIDALRERARHDYGCPAHNALSDESLCTCGLSGALATLDAWLMEPEA